VWRSVLNSKVISIPEHLDTAEDKLFNITYCIVFLGSVLIYFWGIWSIPTLSHNEARRMVVVQEMLANHNWLIPTLNGEIYLAKPPLFYWLAALLGMLFQTTAEWVMRLPSALSAFGITWLLFVRIKKYLGHWEGLFTALVLVTSLELTAFARRAEVEMLLTACCTTALIFYFDYLKQQTKSTYLYLSFLFLGLACLTKGPVALVFFIPPILTFALMKKDKAALRGLLSLRGWGIFALTALPWYIYVYLNLEAQIEGVVSRDVAYKALSFEDRDPLYEYIFVILRAFIPWIVVICYNTKATLKSLVDRSEYAFFTCGFLAPLIIMSLFATKHAKYILPLIPMLAILLGIWLAQLARDVRVRWGDKYFSRSVLAVGVMVAGFFFYYAVVEAQVYRYRYQAFEPLINKVNSSAAGNPVFMYQHLYYRVVYYYGKPIPLLTKREIRNKIARGDNFLIIVDSRSWNDLANENLCVLAEYKPFIKRDRSVRVVASQDLCPPP
jgi:4-amino-4-deoxy-L-arabinose transferase-like glycosyltransferase